MGNKLGCNCGPIGRKPYHRGYDDSQWSNQSSTRSFGKRDGHLLRLWAEVFHVTTAGGGTVKWQQVSEDLVPVNITCIQDSPEVVFHITAYNSQVDKILDVRLVQPGTRIGQASECFVYWKDPVTSDTWGLNFTSPIDAKQFRECCSPAFKFSRKASSSYSLKDNNTRGPVTRSGTLSGTASRGGSGRINTTASTGRRRPLSTPTSPSKSREPQCTCMTAEQYARLRAMDPRFRAASTLPRATPTQQPRQEGSGGGGGREKGPPTDNYATVRRGTETKGTGTVSDMEGEDVRAERLGRGDRERGPGDGARGRGPGRGGRDIVASKSVDYSDNELASRETIDRKKSRSKSTDDVTERNAQAGTGTGRRTATQQQQTEAQATQTAYPRSRTQSGKSTIGTNTTPTGDGLTDSVTLKRLLKPISTTGSVATSPEMTRRVYHHDGYISEPEIRHSSHTQPGKRATDTLRRVHERSRGVGTQTSYGKFKSESSPPSDQPVFDHAYYATTPPSSSPEGEGQGSPSPGSPSARLLLEYEQHLRNTLAKGMDAESYSLHTFEAIISQSNENLSVPPNSRSTTLPRLGGPSRENFRISHDASREASRDSDVLSGYYSDFRDRGYLSDHNSRSSGYYDRHENSKSGYFSDRENRSGYYSDREVHSQQKYGSVRQQISVESADSRLCYLTSSENPLHSAEVELSPREREKQACPALNIITTTTNKKESTEPTSSSSSLSASTTGVTRPPHQPPAPPPPPPPPPLPPPGEPPEITVIPTSSSNPSPETKRTDDQKTAPSPTTSTTKSFFASSSASTPSSPVCSGESKASLLTPTRAKPKLFPKPVLSPRPPPKKLSIPPRAPPSGSADSSLSQSPAASDCSASFIQSPVRGTKSPTPSEPSESAKASPVSSSSSTPRVVTFAPIATVVESSPVRTPSPPPRDYDTPPPIAKHKPDKSVIVGERREGEEEGDEEREDDDERAWSPAKAPRREEVCQNTGRFTVRILPSPSHVRFISQPQPHHVVLRSPRKEAGVATVIPADAPVGAEDLAYYPTSVRTLPNPKRQKFGLSGEKAHVRFASEDELYPPRDYSPEECSTKKTDSLSPTHSLQKYEEKEVEVREAKVKVKDESEKREVEKGSQSIKKKEEVVGKPKVQKPSSTCSTLASSPSSSQPPSSISAPVSSASSSFIQSSNTIVIELSRSESKNSTEQNVVQIQLSPVKSSVPVAPPIQSRNTIQIGLSHREPASPAKSVSSTGEQEEDSPDLRETAESPEPGARKKGQRRDISEGLFWKTAERDVGEVERGENADGDKSLVQTHYDPSQAKAVISFSPLEQEEQQHHHHHHIGSIVKSASALVPEDDYDDEEEDESDEDAWADESPEPEREDGEDSISQLLTLSSSTSTTTASRKQGELKRGGGLGATQPATKQAIVAQVISGFYPLPSVPSPATASPSSASQSSSSTTGPTTVVIPTPPTPVTSNSGGAALLIPSTSAHSQRAEPGPSSSARVGELPISTAAAAAIYATCSKTLPARTSTDKAAARHSHSHLSHYNSIQELYSFVSEVLSSQAEAHGGSSTAVVTASGAGANHPQYTLCKYHLKQKQQRHKLQQKLIIQQQLLQQQQPHSQSQQAQPTPSTSHSHHHPQVSSGASGIAHPHQQQQQHHHHHHPHRGPPPSQTTQQSHIPHQQPSGSSTSRKSQQAVVAQRQQNGQEGSGLQQQQHPHYHHYQQQQQHQALQQQQQHQAHQQQQQHQTHQQQQQQHQAHQQQQQHYQQIQQHQQQYQPQPGVVAARSLTLAHNVSQRQRHHPQTSINQNIYRPVLPGLGDPNTLPRKGAPVTSSAAAGGGGKGSSATLPGHSHHHHHYYQHQQQAPAASSAASVVVATSSGSGGGGGTHPHSHHPHHQVSTSGGGGGTGAGDPNIVKSSAGGASGGGNSVGMVTTAGRAQSAGPTSTSAFYSTLTPIRQPAQQQSLSQPHAFQPVPQRHHHHQQQQQNAQLHHHQQQQQHQHQQQQQHHHQQQQAAAALHPHQFRTPSHQVGCSSSGTSSKHPIQRSVSVAAASTSTTNYSAVQALAASKQYSAAPITLASSSSGAVFQPLASAPSLLTAVTSSNASLVGQNPSISLSQSYDYATIQHVQQQRLHHQQQLAAVAAAKQDQLQQQPIYATHTALQHQQQHSQSQQQVVSVSQSQQLQSQQAATSSLSQSQQQLQHAAHAHHLHHQYYYNTLEHPAYANYYQPAESLTGHEEPISRPVSNLSNKSSEHFYTYPYPRKQQDQIFKPIDWCTLVHWARKAVQSREDDNDIKCECSHGCHEIKGLKRHEHQHSWPHVQPHECNVLFLAKVMQRISDDERMSLTTAVSDDEPGDGANSPKGSRKPAASFNCTGAVRKAGFLSVKKWLLRKRHQVELARRRGWKGYWVCLKGTTLLFYPCDARETSRSVEAAPKHLIIVDGAIMQPIPEHPKRDYIFCLSTAFGDAYLFQAPCQVELESWVHSIHWACAAAFARHRGKTGTLHLLQEEIIRLDKAIESDGKLRHMAELQRSVVADPETRQQLAQQIATWEENIERLHCEQFRLRCYMASLQGGELPNPKSLLSHVSRTTKNTLNRLGVFTVSSFHAYVCARSPSLLSNLLAGRGATKRRAPLLSRSNSASSRRSLHVSSSERENERTAKISLPDNQVVTVPLKDAMSVEEFLVSACARKGLAPMEHFVRVKKRRELPDTNYFVPHRSDLIDTYLSTHEVVEVRAKLLYQVELSRSSLDQMWGFSVEAELVENADRQDELCCYVSRVEERSVAMSNGIIKGDEILVINGAIVSDLDMMYIESVLQEELSLCLMLRSSRTEPPALAAALAAADAAIAQLVCPPPPADPLVLTEDILSHLIVPAPHENKDLSPSDTEEMGGHASGGEQGGRASRADSTEIESLLKTAEQVTGICRTKEQRAGRGGHHHPLTHQRTSTGSLGAESPVAGVSGSSSPTHSHVTMGARDVEKTKKVVLELIDTERAYVKHLTCLLEQYLEPLRHERFLSATEMMAIFGNIREMVSVQRRFLKSLEAALESSTPIESITHPSDFKNILLNIASAFLSFADHFKLYSSFCASHSKAQKLLHPTEGNQALQQFLAARNPRQQHSNTLESYLIKPIQRILKYPLLLQQLRNLCDTNTEEYRNLVEALQCMERVAEHINEMQRIHEEYGAIFEHLFRQHQKLCKTQIDLSPGDLLHYGGVEWLNIADFLGKIKKGLELHAMCFVFRTAVVFLCKERLRHKKKLMGSTSKVSDKSEVEIIRYQVLIPVSEVQVRQIGDPKVPEVDTLGSNYSWELVHLRNQAARRSEKVYLLSNSTAEFRNAFLRNIRQIIRESVRNMSLPPRLSDMTGGEDDDGEAIMTGAEGDGEVIGGPREGTSSSHYATPEGSDFPDRPTASSSSNANAHHRAHQAQTLGRKKPPKPPQRHSAGNLEMGAAGRLRHQESSDSSSGFRSRSKTMSDAAAAEGRRDGTDSEEGREGGISSGSVTMPRVKGMLGNTPIHLTLSTTSTLSAGSTGSAAKLIQASSTPGRSIPTQPALPEPTSPIWKPREGGFDSQTLPRQKSSDHSSEPQPSTSAAAKTPPSNKAETLPRHPR